MSATWLWFDVKLKRYSAVTSPPLCVHGLWFDVKLKRYSAQSTYNKLRKELWFDVKLKRYSAFEKKWHDDYGCGLM